MAFLSSLATYLIEMIVLAAIAVCGVFVGIRLRKNKDAKEDMKK